MAKSYTAAQLYGTGIIIDEAMNDSTTCRLNKVSNHHVYITFDVVSSNPIEYMLAKGKAFVRQDANGNKLHLAYSNTNWAYSFPKGHWDSGEFLIAANPSFNIAANTVRVRGLGLDKTD